MGQYEPLYPKVSTKWDRTNEYHYTPRLVLNGTVMNH